MTLEQLQQAHEVGATHYSPKTMVLVKEFTDPHEPFKAYSDKTEYRYAGWCDVIRNASVDDCNILKIDYSPLTDYQQDKALDIAVTGIAE